MSICDCGGAVHAGGLVCLCACVCLLLMLFAHMHVGRKQGATNALYMSVRVRSCMPHHVHELKLQCNHTISERTSNFFYAQRPRHTAENHRTHITRNKYLACAAMGAVRRPKSSLSATVLGSLSLH
jgi:hypothetical protein